VQFFGPPPIYVCFLCMLRSMNFFRHQNFCQFSWTSGFIVIVDDINTIAVVSGWKCADLSVAVCTRRCRFVAAERPKNPHACTLSNRRSSISRRSTSLLVERQLGLESLMTSLWRDTLPNRVRVSCIYDTPVAICYWWTTGKTVKCVMLPKCSIG